MVEIGDTGFDWADVFEDVVDRAGGGTATAQDVNRVRRGLRLITERWNIEGYNLWRVCSTTVGVGGVDGCVSLPSGIDDVINVAARDERGSTIASLHRLSETEYARLYKRDPRHEADYGYDYGLPTQYALRRTDPPALLVWPIGQQHLSCELEVTYVARPGRFQRYDDPDTQEVAGRWLEALVLCLAHDLARKRPPYDEALISRLTSEMAAAEVLAQRGDRGRQRYRYRIGGARHGR